MTLWQRWKQTALHNKALVFTGVLVAFGTLFYAGAAVIQVCIMRADAHQSANQAQRLIDASERVAKAEQDSANSFRASIEQSRKYLTEATRQTALDMRAWISVKADMKLRDPNSNTIKAGDVFSVRVTTKNNGRTPALRVRSVIKRTIREARPDKEFLAPDFVYKNADYVEGG